MPRLESLKGAPLGWLARSIRRKLLALALLPLVVVLPVLIGVLVYLSGPSYDRLLTYKVRSDLAVAHGYFERVKEGVGRSVASFAGSAQLDRALGRSCAGDAGAAGDLLQSMRQRLGLDFIHLADANGRITATTSALPAGTALDAWPVVRAALNGSAATEIEIFPPELLGRLDPALRERAHTPLVGTRNAAPTTRAAETRGMVIHAAAPVPGDGGRLDTILVGGMLLNKNLQFVDRINEIVYPDGALPLDSRGTATLFLDDVRIATNVRLFEGARAIGTRVSQSVRNAVLGEGRTWLDSAFVVNDWYVSAYEPIEDSGGRRVGMLYVGYLEKPFLRVKQIILTAIIAVFIATMLAVALLSLRVAGGIFRPVERMHGTMSAVESGDASARVGEVVGRDEIGELAAHLDRLLDRLHEQTVALRRWGEELDQRVAERTRQLEEAYERLRSTQRQLVTSEKLAAVGQLTAGVAHEINNPIAVIQGNLDVLREILGARATPVREEIRLIQDQVHRIRLIVTKLLQFARPAEYAGYLEIVDTGQVVQDSLVLVGHQMRKGNVAISERFRASRTVTINRNELQQVLINLMVNALQAMPDGGTLTLETADWIEDSKPKGVTITIADTGAGIPPDALEHVFNPFFTTKKTAGTGLGLWVSHGIVERYGGRITIDSAPGGGAAFTVWLPEEPGFSLDQGKPGEETTLLAIGS